MLCLSCGQVICMTQFTEDSHTGITEGTKHQKQEEAILRKVIMQETKPHQIILRSSSQSS